MNDDRPLGRSPRLITIPSSDAAFRAHVAGLGVDGSGDARELERRLRRMFPRVVVRDRALSGEPSAWYVYRDGSWRPPVDGPWWKDESLPRVVVTRDGWLADVNPIAAGLLGISGDFREHHFTDFVVPGTLGDATALFGVIERGSELTATIVLRPTSGDVIAVELHAATDGDHVVGVLRLAADVDVALEPSEADTPDAVVTRPPTDVAFRSYVLRAMRRMPEPTIGGLVLRLRRLYPHAAVRPGGDTWVAERDPRAPGGPDAGWWADATLPRVRYDAQALILEANEAAAIFLGRDLVGQYWQDLVTPGSTDEVGLMLEILQEIGAAETRFRMPRSDGTLVEFDSYTTVTDEQFVTVMRPFEPVAAPTGVARQSLVGPQFV